MKTPTAVIFDLDNCLSNDEHRLSLIDLSRPDVDDRYEAYHELCHEDTPCNVQVFREAIVGIDEIAFFTSRPESARAKTMAWISRWFGVVQYWLLMRPTGDHQPSADLKRQHLVRFGKSFPRGINVVRAYDDREDVLSMYAGCNIETTRLCAYDQKTETERKETQTSKSQDAAAVLDKMAAVFRERNGIYKDNYKLVPKLVSALWPKGVPPELTLTEHWHLFELMLVKLARFANSGLTHQDSIMDAGVYSAMITAIIKEKGNQ